MLPQGIAFTFFSHIEHLGTFFCPQDGQKNRAFRSNSSPRLRRVCGISASIPCAPRAICASRNLILYNDGKRRCPGLFLPAFVSGNAPFMGSRPVEITGFLCKIYVFVCGFSYILLCKVS
jgi:hypothetical protein